MTAPVSNVRSVRPVEDREYARTVALGQTAAQVEWAISAIEAGEPQRALEYLAKAQRAMMPVVPSVRLGGSEFYVPSVRSVA